MQVQKMSEKVQTSKKKLNVVVCIYHELGFYKKSLINKMLENLQINLKKECDSYQEVQVAYVYETPALDVKQFQKLEKDTPIYYKEPCEVSETHNLSRVWFMGLALLEQKAGKIEKEIQDMIENRLYLLTDEKFWRVHVNQLVWEQEEKVVLHPRFSHVRFMPILIKTENAGGDLLEKYIRAYGEVLIYR